MQAPAFPLPTRIEWHLAKSRWLAAAIDVAVHGPRKRLHARPPTLAAYERRVYSQNGEDGILEHIFARIGTTNRFAVEFGVEYGHECLTRRLAFEEDWAGLLLEGAPWWMPRLRELYAGTRVTTREAFVTVESILPLLDEASVPKGPDLLVVDIDGNDYWVLERILTAYRPRVIAVEYNGRFAPPTDWVMPYNPAHTWDGSAYHGASLQALYRLAGAHGYALATCESRGVNAFFVRRELWPDHGTARGHYVAPRFGRGFGHPVRMRMHQKSPVSAD